MIARSRSKCWIIQLKEENQDLVLASTQRGIKGNVIIYPQQPSKVAESLPPTVEEITAPVCILFVGSSAPTPEWLRDHAKPLAVNANRVRNALLWLKEHNPLYKGIKINEECLQQLERDPVLPFNIEHVRSSAASEAVTSRYDSTPTLAEASPSKTDDSIPFQNVVITDVDCHASSNELRAAALRHVKKSGGGYIQIPHDHSPENEFRKDSLLFPLMYPTLFPYGIGGPNDSRRAVPLSMKHHNIRRSDLL
ncbi:hypothetical protein DFH08DRAFT_1025728 [Mycena albidolilacea]|uniref:DUF6570 domain-containing protein n=1 Tax=Mycena albidolilacea TaxID=1033008 RepID=A0AAD7AMM2_9AGAR|nr:hypothetical protein DFH08DRAFT_1025728 [Mycena albidolilacea]